MKKVLLGLLICINQVYANPYPFEHLVPKDSENEFIYQKKMQNFPVVSFGKKIMRIQVNWDNESYSMGQNYIEFSGTEALYKRVRKQDELGSYQAIIYDLETKKPIFFESIGTGKEFRKLSRAMSFRFPYLNNSFRFIMKAENPETGEMEIVIDKNLNPQSFTEVPKMNSLEVKGLRKALKGPSLKFVIYSEGYKASEKKQFYKEALKAVNVLEKNNFPGQEYWEFIAVFSPSNLALSKAKKRAKNKIIVRDSFLGLDHPYWNSFGRWYHVVYPTSVEKYRNALGQVAYDYPLAIVNSRRYWGVGNFKELTAIPGSNSRFTYLLLHELGHFFGLNEEYQGGGRTELEFSPNIKEPWSQNITFLNDVKNLKWKHLLKETTPIPTPRKYWGWTKKEYGAYKGGYADSLPRGRSYKPGFKCVMEDGRKFCPICSHALDQRRKFDQGEKR